jgi:alkaline ceramidase
MMILFKDFANNVTQGIHVIWLLLIAVGFGSVYFHATLTMVIEHC